MAFVWPDRYDPDQDLLEVPEDMTTICILNRPPSSPGTQRHALIVRFHVP